MKYIAPVYLQNFKCDGTLCESYCCREWKIAIDEETRDKYEKLPEEKRQKILSKLNEKDGQFYPVKLTDKGVCPFLREDLLCDLQKNLGEDYLSNICYSYPRVTTKINNRIFQSLTLSCPIAAELVLFSNGISFVESKKISPRIGWLIDFSERIQATDELVEDMVSAGLYILKDNSHSINDRLKILLEFYIKSDEYINENEKLKKLLNSVENNSFQRDFSEEIFTKNENIIFNKSEFFEIIVKLYNALYDVKFNDNKIEELKKIYEDNFEEFEENIITNNSQIFTNYLMNEFFMRVYPFAFKESFSANIKVFILSWRALAFALFMLYEESGLSKDRLILGVRRLVERMDHGKGVMKKVIDIAKQL